MASWLLLGSGLASAWLCMASAWLPLGFFLACPLLLIGFDLVPICLSLKGFSQDALWHPFSFGMASAWRLLGSCWPAQVISVIEHMFHALPKFLS